MSFFIVYLVPILKPLATGFPSRSWFELVHLNLGNAQGGQILYKGALDYRVASINTSCLEASSRFCKTAYEGEIVHCEIKLVK